ncbi:MAG: ATP-dependent helicase HepA [Bacteroidetes bacterium ADurb.Bin217]|nr:MAG: ATP-dependent helicase HepA [Bacteroidetes bacterium ADurb.Bin217]
MESRFAVIIQKHRLIGWILAPFNIVKSADKDFYEPVEYLLPESNTMYTASYEKKIISLIAKYDDKQLFTRFAKRKKDAQKDFLEKVKDDYFAEEIRPYIEKQIYECYKLIREHNIPLYIREGEANLYAEDLILFPKEQPKITFNFNKTATGLEYGLNVVVSEKPVTLEGKPFVVLSNAPGLLLVEKTLYHLQNIDSKKLLPFFTKKHILIPQKFEQQYFDTFVLNCIKNYTVTNVGFEIVDIHEKPSISASIVRDISNNAAIEFGISYRKWKLNDFWNPQAYSVEYTNVKNTPKYIRIHRDFEFEKSFIALLNQEKLINDNYLWKVQNFNSDGYYDILQWIREHKHIIDSYNIEVFDESDKKIQNLQAQIDISVSSDSIDWFDVHAVVSFGEYKIPFKRLRKNILLEDPVVHLPNNQIGIIPTEWFARFKDLFLFSSKNQDPEIFSLKTIHYKTIQRLPIDFSDALKTRFLNIDTNGIRNNEVPSEIQATLRPYQVEGYRWLCYLDANNFGGCLADDMGLGKTLQTITLLQRVINVQKESNIKPTNLVVAPASIVHNWYNEFKKFAPGIKIFKYEGNDRNKELMYLKKYHVVITTYGLLRNDIESFEKFPFYYTILDESQMIKNPDSKIYSAVLRLQSQRRLVLTGTPIENSLVDLWAQLNFVNRDMLGSLAFFKEHFIKGTEKQNELIESQLKKIVKPFIFRREKQEVAKDLPALMEQVRICKMSDKQEKIYETEKSKVRNMIFETIEKEAFQKSTINVLQALMRLRQIANHPQLLDEFNSDSGKFEEVIRVLQNLIHNHKVLIFSSFVKHLDLFKQYFENEGLQYAYLTGSTKNREQIIQEFQENDACKVFLISIKAGGVGLNLTKADYVFILDPWWNPAVENQAISRAHRIGQKNNVNVYRFISENTIEEKIQRLQRKKSELAKNYIYEEHSIPFTQEEVSYLVE